jgi:hypothetical protein
MPLLPPAAAQVHPTIEEWPHDQDFSRGPKAFLEGGLPANGTVKVLSPEAIQRRRQQNRASQLAFRARTKKMVEELRHQLTQCAQNNQTMYLTMQNLLEKTESLKAAIEGALASQRSMIFEQQQKEKGMPSPSSLQNRTLNLQRDCDG